MAVKGFHPIHPDTAVELGKRAIIDHLKDQMRLHQVDPTTVGFEWEHGRIYSRWFLRILKGESKLTLKFMERDVVEWPRRGEIASKYATVMLRVIEQLKKG